MTLSFDPETVLRGYGFLTYPESISHLWLGDGGV